jgi:hypothetical protein
MDEGSKSCRKEKGWTCREYSLYMPWRQAACSRQRSSALTEMLKVRGWPFLSVDGEVSWQVKALPLSYTFFSNPSLPCPASTNAQSYGVNPNLNPHFRIVVALVKNGRYRHPRHLDSGSSGQLVRPLSLVSLRKSNFGSGH